MVTYSDLCTSAGVKDIPVASAAVVYTAAVPISFGAYFSLSYKATNAAQNVKLKIEYQVSWEMPDSDADDADWVEPESASDIETALATKTQHVKAITPVVAKFLRIKITGVAGDSANGAATTIRLKLGIDDGI